MGCRDLEDGLEISWNRKSQVLGVVDAVLGHNARVQDGRKLLLLLLLMLEYFSLLLLLSYLWLGGMLLRFLSRTVNPIVYIFFLLFEIWWDY